MALFAIYSLSNAEKVDCKSIHQKYENSLKNAALSRYSNFGDRSTVDLETSKLLYSLLEKNKCKLPNDPLATEKYLPEVYACDDAQRDWKMKYANSLGAKPVFTAADANNALNNYQSTCNSQKWPDKP